MDSFLQWQIENWKDDDFFPPELEHTKAINMLVDYLLGEDWYFVPPVNAKQGNVYILHAILMKYSRKYRHEVKKYRKHISSKRGQ
jgi:hypothetical protein